MRSNPLNDGSHRPMAFSMTIGRLELEIKEV
jgi:hypothetical protein